MVPFGKLCRVQQQLLFIVSHFLQHCLGVSQAAFIFQHHQKRIIHSNFPNEFFRGRSVWENGFSREGTLENRSTLVFF
jgi:hypothetical protein